MAEPYVAAEDINPAIAGASPAERAKLKRQARFLAGRPIYAMTKAA